MVWAPRVTVAAIVERNQEYLCVRETILGKQVINQPAGHLEQHETLIQAVQRETLEETGWTVEPQSVIGIYLWSPPDQNLTFLRVTFHCTGVELNPHAPIDPDIDDAVWLTEQQIESQKSSLRSPLVLQCVYDYKQGKRYPLTILSSIH